MSLDLDNVQKKLDLDSTKTYTVTKLGVKLLLGFLDKNQNLEFKGFILFHILVWFCIYSLAMLSFAPAEQSFFFQHHLDHNFFPDLLLPSDSTAVKALLNHFLKEVRKY